MAPWNSNGLKLERKDQTWCKHPDDASFRTTQRSRSWIASYWCTSGFFQWAKLFVYVIDVLPETSPGMSSTISRGREARRIKPAAVGAPPFLSHPGVPYWRARKRWKPLASDWWTTLNRTPRVRPARFLFFFNKKY